MTDSQDMMEAPDKDARTWGMACHLSALCTFIIPFGQILGPLVVWLIKRNEMPFVDDQGKESINFQLTLLIMFVISGILIFVVVGFFLMIILLIYMLIMVIVASIKANEGVMYRYPYTIRFIK